MEDLTRNYTKPCIMDIKMGRKTWYEGAPQKYIDKCLVKDATTTSGSLGYRVAGMQVHDSSTGAMWRADRKWCQNLTNQQMPAVFRLFFSSTPTADAPAVDAIAAAAAAAGAAGAAAAGVALSAEAKQRMRGILCGEGGLLAQLQTLRDWFTQQSSFHFPFPFPLSISSFHFLFPFPLSISSFHFLFPFPLSISSFHFLFPFPLSISSFHFLFPFPLSISSFHFLFPFPLSISSFHFLFPFPLSISSFHFLFPFPLSISSFHFLFPFPLSISSFHFLFPFPLSISSFHFLFPFPLSISSFHFLFPFPLSISSFHFLSASILIIHEKGNWETKSALKGFPYSSDFTPFLLTFLCTHHHCPFTGSSSRPPSFHFVSASILLFCKEESGDGSAAMCISHLIRATFLSFSFLSHSAQLTAIAAPSPHRFAQQTTFHFFSASILLIYEANTGEHEGAEAKEEGKEAGSGAAHPPSLRLVDFAHAIDAQGKVDENFLQAVDGVMAAWKGVLGE
ncbi:unnamed protein product [Closterium sp. Naga37s-1]|nr:unnamed protein product [Closterium sp. Naga37s-1]